MTPSTPQEPIRALIEDAEAVVKAVTRDDCGQMVGKIWMGGNGGLLSRETLRAVDKLRLTIEGVKRVDEAVKTEESRDFPAEQE